MDCSPRSRGTSGPAACHFQIPDAPAPHWQVVDSRGNVYLLQRLKIKGDKFNKQIVLPPYVQDVAKVQIWCAWAETLLGEAPFDAPVSDPRRKHVGL